MITLWLIEQCSDKCLKQKCYTFPFKIKHTGYGSKAQYKYAHTNEESNTKIHILNGQAACV